MQLPKAEIKNRRLVKILELHAYLGGVMPVGTLKRKAISGEIPSMKIGRHRIFDLDAIDEWLEKRGKF